MIYGKSDGMANETDTTAACRGFWSLFGVWGLGLRFLVWGPLLRGLGRVSLPHRFVWRGGLGLWAGDLKSKNWLCFRV